MKSYECPSCKHQFSNTHKNWSGIVLLQYCPNPNCAMPLPEGLLPEFVCDNCRKTKPIAELGSINSLAKVIVSLPTPRMRRICSECCPQVNLFGWFIFILFVVPLAAFLYKKVIHYF